MRIFTLLKKAFTKIQALSATINAMDDYIVEQGTSGIWTYEKCKNGIIKLWGNESFKSGAWSGSSIYYGPTRKTPLPSGLLKSYKYANVAVESASGAVTYATNISIDTAFTYVSSYYVRIYGGNDNITIHIMLEVIGTWK